MQAFQLYPISYEVDACFNNNICLCHLFVTWNLNSRNILQATKLLGKRQTENLL